MIFIFCVINFGLLALLVQKCMFLLSDHSVRNGLEAQKKSINIARKKFTPKVREPLLGKKKHIYCNNYKQIWNFKKVWWGEIIRWQCDQTYSEWNWLRKPKQTYLKYYFVANSLYRLILDRFDGKIWKVCQKLKLIVTILAHYYYSL